MSQDEKDPVRRKLEEFASSQDAQNKRIDSLGWKTRLVYWFAAVGVTALITELADKLTKLLDAGTRFVNALAGLVGALERFFSGVW